jgi:hypothetical protein
MKTQSVSKPDRAQSLDQDIHRLRQQLDALKKHLMLYPSATTAIGCVKKTLNA